ncbi:SDR family oxidoreductase [Jannaschia sp. S6380]|uniref:SDR family NAD(P)-dependent oxidoreductase n=1 Tax=Jannaschia sp. S6380 TaxID=2926408 RepID=UPI001FF6E807|nr:SDR family oxidoreductase [Jannaschia sp. S6380]MCK0168201.1 SDR family oxidoreductase [Jannaschia sp. S6380]
MAREAALITGASAGIGKELARIHAARGGDVILVARCEDVLRELKAELEQAHGITAHVFAADLGSVEGTRELHARVRAAGLPVDVLINNAGFSHHGAFHELDLNRALSIVELNVKSLMTLTRLVLPDMVARGAGRILNVGSTAGMIPGPLQATYHASKAFVNSFSQAIAEEVADAGVTVTVLAPGAVATEFFERADMADMKGVQQGVAQASDVARIGYDAMTRGELLVISDRRLRFMLNWMVPFLPRRRVLKMARDFGEKTG